MSEERNELNLVTGSVIWDDHWDEPAQNSDGSRMFVENNGAWLKETKCYDACQCGGCWTDHTWFEFGKGRLSLKQNKQKTLLR